MRLTNPGWLGAALLLFTVAAARAERYTYTILSPPGGVVGAHGLNNLDQVVGFANRRTGSGGFVWDAGTYSYFNSTLPGASISPSAINDRGEVVGLFSKGGVLSPMIYRGGKVTRPFKGPGFTVASGVNRRGTIVGTFGPNGGPYQGFTYRAGVIRPISPPGAGDSSAAAINDRGDVVGTVGFSRGYVYSGGQFTEFEVPDSYVTDPVFIGPGGVIAGSNVTKGDNVRHGFVRLANGAFRRYDVPGAYDTRVVALGPAGQVVGTYRTSAPGRYEYRSFSFSDGTFHDIKPPGFTEGEIVEVDINGVNTRSSLVASVLTKRSGFSFIATCPAAPGTCTD